MVSGRLVAVNSLRDAKGGKTLGRGRQSTGESRFIFPSESLNPKDSGNLSVGRDRVAAPRRAAPVATGRGDEIFKRFPLTGRFILIEDKVKGVVRRVTLRM